MPRYVAILVLLASGIASATEVRWLPVHMERGCVSLQDLYGAYPELDRAKTPDEMLSALRKGHENVRSRPFVELSADPRLAEESRSKPDPARKFFTKSNAVLITWGEDDDGDGILLYTEDLCRALYRTQTQ
jgi:hypothetical protein